ncbi:D-tyrosyl-tRNA deacylase [Meira miltonrushii]|uniref:D-aminoacyl-tRNA deacylase n=1 Tax=Meira miltonrushii TaxID=1280837 RepID=A0A316V0X4_9BASI|nr:D-tyrosyl-tRNA deacylase [Meira miltonrushii]PWN31196.1 D-tyrosyl-tRNA deacylase [Meira miltonrushii]
MRAVLQRVTGATVHVDGKLISRIGPGIVALIGIGVEDTAEEITPISQKILTTKLWNEGQKASQIVVPPQYSTDQTTNPTTDTPTKPAAEANDDIQKARSEQVWGGKPWKQNVMDLEGEVMCISQFTLHARLSKGTKPDFHKSMGGEQAKILYEQLLERLGKTYRPDRIKDGAFGEMMQCSLTNDGPVTILIDTADNKK